MKDKLIYSVSILFAFVFVHSVDAQTWVIGPTTGQHTTIVDPSGNHHIIVDQGRHGGFYQHPQPGLNQYPNPVDSGLQNFRRGAEWGQWLRSLRRD